MNVWQQRVSVAAILSVCVIAVAPAARAGNNQALLDYINSNKVINPAVVAKLERRSRHSEDPPDTPRVVRSIFDEGGALKVKEESNTQAQTRTSPQDSASLSSQNQSQRHWSRLAEIAVQSAERTKQTGVPAPDEFGDTQAIVSGIKANLGIAALRVPQPSRAKSGVDELSSQTLSNFPMSKDRLSTTQAPAPARVRVGLLRYRLQGISVTSNTGRRVTYTARGKSWSVISGYEGEKIFYEKTRMIGGKSYKIVFKYLPSERAKYERIIAAMRRRF